VEKQCRKFGRIWSSRAKRLVEVVDEGEEMMSKLLCASGKKKPKNCFSPLRGPVQRNGSEREVQTLIFWCTFLCCFIVQVRGLLWPSEGETTFPVHVGMELDHYHFPNDPIHASIFFTWDTVVMYLDIMTQVQPWLISPYSKTRYVSGATWPWISANQCKI
jgi:hypothetical protein